MKTKLLIGCVALQVLILAVMAGQREWVARTGRVVWFRTAPVDPRDAMRGDYVQLNYDFSRVPRELCRGELASGNVPFDKVPADTQVYAALRVEEDGVAKLASLGLDRPRDGLYLRGRTQPISALDLQVRYGLEAWFLEQGKGREIEQGRNREGIQVPLEMQAAVSPGGIVVLKDHRWCALGIGLNFETTAEATAERGPRPRRLVAATVRLLNASSNDVALVDLPGGRSLALVPDHTWGQNPWRWSPASTNQPAPTAANVVVLKPGQIHSIRVAFDDSEWLVSNANKPGETKHLNELAHEWNGRFRLEYRPPDRAACADLPQANIIWHGTLPSRAFSPVGNVD
jgi:uncharacterized membrane-anchored protein